MNKIKDLTGQIFGKLCVRKFSHINKHRSACFLCTCKCGNEKVISGHHLLSKKYPARTCGECSKHEMIGKRFGKIVVISYLRTDKYRVFKCKCDCGNIIERPIACLSISGIKSCRQCHVYEMIGRRFGRITVLEYEGKRGRASYFVCKCDCGNTKSIYGYSLVCGGKNISCGKCYKYEMIGKKFNKLEITKYSHRDECSYFFCKCDCGNTVVKPGSSVKSGHTKSCGECYKMAHAGEKYGCLEVIEFSHTKNNKTHFTCKCDCGSKTIVSKSNLKGGNTLSCGCIKVVKQMRLAKIVSNMLNEDYMTIRPNWLKNPKTGHNLEIDIYFPKSKIAIEYNGIQHYIPVNFSGRLTEKEMLEQLKNTQRRDRVKKRLVKLNSDKVKHFIIFSYRNRIEENNVKAILEKHLVFHSNTK